MSVDMVYYDYEDIRCPGCDSDNVDYSANYGSVEYHDEKMDHSTLKCRDCGDRWDAYHPWQGDGE